MSPFRLLTVLCLSLLTTSSSAHRRAQPALQHRGRLEARSEYQGGWPLALTGSNSPSCPAIANSSCPVTSDVNPACCPAGQTCFVDYVTQYCCPTNADCKTAVENFPVCANSTWNMFASEYSGFFCCIPGQIGVNPVSVFGALCEPGDQVVPQSLLATKVGQTTATATAVVSVPSAATGAPLETNPTAIPTSAVNSSNVGDDFNGLPLGAKIGIGAALVLFVLAIISCVLFRRRYYVVPEHSYTSMPYHAHLGTTSYDSSGGGGG